MNQQFDKQRNFAYYVQLMLKGFCMGMADIIPGVSGGTIAFILGIYEEFILSIKSFDLNFLRLLCQFKFKEAFQTVSWKFLGVLLLGIGCAILSLSRLLSWLLVHHPIYINAFFFGLILATVPIIGNIVKKWNMGKIILLIILAAITFVFVGLVPIQTPNTAWFIFLSGALAISAMILPGISGAFILVLLGKYQWVLEAVNDRDLFSLSILVAGICFGVITFVRVLSWLFKKYHDITVVSLTGIVLGSLNKIWPWKLNISVLEVKPGKVIPIDQVNRFPTQLNNEVIIAIILIVFGFILALILNKSHKAETLELN